MKKLCILAVSIVLAVSVFSGCDKKDESSSEEATSPVSAEETQRKTEKEVVRVSQGMLPQPQQYRFASQLPSTRS